MRLLSLLIFLVILANANMKIFDNYIEGKDYEKLMDKFLFSDNYIYHLLKNKDVKFGYYSHPINIIICYKNKRILNLYKYKNNSITLEKQFKNILTGKNSGDKWNEGDGKTPIGIYTLKYRYNDNQLNDFYGPLAYTTNYPNLYDNYLGKEGHGIWIHGFPKNDPHRDFDTKGCIALPNSALKHLSMLLENYKNSIVIIDDHNIPTTNKQKIYYILKQIFEWRYSWKYNQLNKYFSFYDKENFKKSNKYNFKQFKYMKKTVFSYQKNKTLKFSNLKIIPYPNIDGTDIYKVEFDEFFKSGSHQFKGKKILYLRLIKNKISIFIES